MTNLFLEYEQNKKVKENPELLVGQTRYWNKSWYGKTLDFELGNAFIVEFYEPSRNICRVKYFRGGFSGDEYPEFIINNSAETLVKLAPDT